MWVASEADKSAKLMVQITKVVKYLKRKHLRPLLWAADTAAAAAAAAAAAVEFVTGEEAVASEFAYFELAVFVPIEWSSTLSTGE